MSRIIVPALYETETDAAKTLMMSGDIFAVGDAILYHGKQFRCRK